MRPERLPGCSASSPPPDGEDGRRDSAAGGLAGCHIGDRGGL